MNLNNNVVFYLQLSLSITVSINFSLNDSRLHCRIAKMIFRAVTLYHQESLQKIFYDQVDDRIHVIQFYRNRYWTQTLRKPALTVRC